MKNLLLFIAIAFIFSHCDEKENPVKIQKIDVVGSNITNGGTSQMTANVTPTDASIKDILWSVSDNTIATISTTGLVTAIANGSVIVKATAGDGSGVTGTLTIVITGVGAGPSSNVNVTAITVAGNNITNGKTSQMTATVSPSNATNKSITWSVSDNSVATISATGLVTSLTNGTVIVTATAQDGSNVHGTYTLAISGKQKEITLTKLSNYSVAIPANLANQNAMTAFTVSGKGYVCDYNGKFYQYDPAANKWNQKKDYPNPLSNVAGLVGFAINARGYVGLGGDAVGHSFGIYEYDPSNDSWLKVDDNIPLVWGAPYGYFFVYANKVYVNNGPSEKYYQGTTTPGTSIAWTLKTNFPNNAQSSMSAAFPIGDKIYIGAGSNNRAFWVYDPINEKWTQLKNAPDDLQGARNFFVLKGEGYYVNRTSCWNYNPTNDSWEKLNFPTSPSVATAFTIGDVAYLLFTDGTFYSLSTP